MSSTTPRKVEPHPHNGMFNHILWGWQRLCIIYRVSTRVYWSLSATLTEIHLLTFWQGTTQRRLFRHSQCSDISCYTKCACSLCHRTICRLPENWSFVASRLERHLPWQYDVSRSICAGVSLHARFEMVYKTNNHQAGIITYICGYTGVADPPLSAQAERSLSNESASVWSHSRIHCFPWRWTELHGWSV